MRLFLIAMQFLTIIPLPAKIRWENGDLGRSLAAFPLAGLTIGAMLAGLNWLIVPWLNRPLADALLITALTAITGALHLDGLADVCDGLGARGGRERFLAIMKDSHIGAIGAVGLVLGLLLKWQALVAIAPAEKTAALLLFPTIARFVQVQSIVFAKNARQDGLGRTLIDGAGIRQLIVASAITIAAAALLLGIKGLVVLATAYICTWLLKTWFHRLIGGLTGDVVGCISELNEIVVLLLISALPVIAL